MLHFFPSRLLACFASLLFLSFNANAANTVNTLAYLQAHIAAPATASTVTKYDRLKQFGAWVKQNPANPCRDTREMVLETANNPGTPLTFAANGCTITAGLWAEPYTGVEVTDATDLQIDHVVPLELAYYAGAYAWKGPIRCTYANFIANDYHLRAVNSHENMAKGDRGPDGYLPPNAADLCDYVSSWMKIKTIWQLTATQAEVTAIQSVLQKENCAASFENMDAADLANQRAQAASPIAACANFPD